MFAYVESIPKRAKQAWDEVKNMVLELSADGSNANLFYAACTPAEQKAFCRNEGGWPRNDIDMFINMENQQVAVELLSRLQEIPQKGFPSDENPDVIRMGMMSKYQQSESEVTQWIEQQLDYAEIKAEQERLEADRKLSAEERETMLKEFIDNLSSEERDIWLKAKRQKWIEDMLQADADIKKSKKK